MWLKKILVPQFLLSKLSIAWTSYPCDSLWKLIEICNKMKDYVFTFTASKINTTYQISTFPSFLLWHRSPSVFALQLLTRSYERNCILSRSNTKTNLDAFLQVFKIVMWDFAVMFYSMWNIHISTNYFHRWEHIYHINRPSFLFQIASKDMLCSEFIFRKRIRSVWYQARYFCLHLDETTVLN